MKQQLVLALSTAMAIGGAFAQTPEAGPVFTAPAPGMAGEAGNRVVFRGSSVAGTKDQGFAFISSEFSFDGAVVKNAPYSAEAVTETTQRLADGNRISRKTTASVYRDSEGRTRREETIGSIGPWAANSEPLQTVFINDPVSRTNLVLDARTKTVRKMPTPEILPLPPGTPGSGMVVSGGMAQADRMRDHVAIKTFSREAPVAVNTTGVFTTAIAGGAAASGDNVKTESLGSQMIEGVRADGTRTTITIPAGAVGNERPIDIVSERWYSPELQTVVKSTHSDPRMEETVYRLTNISRNEPPQSLFVAPADYTVTENEMRLKMIDEQKAIFEKSIQIRNKD